MAWNKTVGISIQGSEGPKGDTGSKGEPGDSLLISKIFLRDQTLNDPNYLLACDVALVDGYYKVSIYARSTIAGAAAGSLTVGIITRDDTSQAFTIPALTLDLEGGAYNAAQAQIFIEYKTGVWNGIKANIGYTDGGGCNVPKYNLIFFVHQIYEGFS
jgi:hypothetical protein